MINFRPLSSSSKGNCYIVESGDTAPLLLECGLPIKAIRERLNFSLSGLAGCLISHEHGDHSKAAKDLLKSGVDVWTSKLSSEGIGIENHHRTFITIDGKPESISGWVVYPFGLNHDTPTQGFFISSPDKENILFVPDTAYVKNRFTGINILAIECNYIADRLSQNIQSGTISQAIGRRVRRNHMSLDTVIGMLKANDTSALREVWLLHLSDLNSDEEVMKSKVQEAIGVPVYVAKS